MSTRPDFCGVQPRCPDDPRLFAAKSGFFDPRFWAPPTGDIPHLLGCVVYPLDCRVECYQNFDCFTLGLGTKHCIHDQVSRHYKPRGRGRTVAAVTHSTSGASHASHSMRDKPLPH